jgi:hypothetical protein
MLVDRAARSAWAVLAAIKNAVVPDETRDYRIRAGIARGAFLRTNLRYGTRMLFGLYEGEIASWTRRFVRPGSVCYDIGAADGYYALAFARLARPGRVFCFEPDRNLARHLEETIRRNQHLGSDIQVHAFKLGAHDMGRNATTLDALVYEDGWPAPDVIKMDVDGGERDVLRGGTRVLREHHPRVILEVHSIDLEKQCIALLENAGYLTTTVENRRYMAEDVFRRIHNRWVCAEAPRADGV